MCIVGLLSLIGSRDPIRSSVINNALPQQDGGQWYAMIVTVLYYNVCYCVAGRVPFPSQASCYQYPVHYPTSAPYGIQPSHHAAYLQQPQPHPLTATAQFSSVNHAHQMCSVPASQQVISPVGVSSPTHPFQQPASLLISNGPRQ